jgi:hypothetical protein
MLTSGSVALGSPSRRRFRLKNAGRGKKLWVAPLLVRRVFFGRLYVDFYVFDRPVISFYYGNQFDQLSSLQVDLLRGFLRH